MRLPGNLPDCLADKTTDFPQENGKSDVTISCYKGQ